MTEKTGGKDRDKPRSKDEMNVRNPALRRLITVCISFPALSYCYRKVSCQPVLIRISN